MLIKQPSDVIATSRKRRSSGPSLTGARPMWLKPPVGRHIRRYYTSTPSSDRGRGAETGGPAGSEPPPTHRGGRFCRTPNKASDPNPDVSEMFREMLLFLTLVPEKACPRKRSLGLFQEPFPEGLFLEHAPKLPQARKGEAYELQGESIAKTMQKHLLFRFDVLPGAYL